MCARSFFRLFRNGCAAAHLCRGAAVPEGRRAPLFFAGTALFSALIAGRFFMPETKNREINRPDVLTTGGVVI